MLATAPASAADRTIGITSFDKVKVDGPFVVTVATGKGVSAKASGDRDAVDRVSLRIEGRLLTVTTDRSAWSGWPGAQHGTATIALTTPQLQSAFLAGSGSVTVDAMKGPRLTLIVDGSGRMKVAAVTTDRIDVAVSGSGRIELAGVTKDANLGLRGTGELDASRLQVNDLVVASESAGAITAQARRTAKVVASGAGTVEIAGKPACTVKQLGSGPVSCGQ